MLRMLAIISLGACALAAHAQQPVMEDATGPSMSTTAMVAVGAQAHAGAADRDARADDRPFCLRDTGSRIKARGTGDTRCINASGRSYSRDDLERTGASSTAEALRRLDPRLN